MSASLQHMVSESAVYLERNYGCRKHHVKHVGSTCYLLDFYTELDQVEKGVQLIHYLLEQIVDTKWGAQFYPGSMNPMNMSNSIIDTGACVDSIARFARLHRGAIPPKMHALIERSLRRVVETYLIKAVEERVITNQRLWGLTGVASFAAYVGEESRYHALAHSCIQRAFRDMTDEGFFRYYPGAAQLDIFEGYDGISEFYQSRCSAFMRYALELLQMDETPYREQFALAGRALLSLYRADGLKDLRLECKRWYWQSDYEVAASGFDIYALARAGEPAAAAALTNALYQLRRHWYDGHLHAHRGAHINFQCPIFWTAHLAWALRVRGIAALFAASEQIVPFRFRHQGKHFFSDTTPVRRILVNAHFSARNPTMGIFDNGLPHAAHWSLRVPHAPPAFIFSVREVLNKSWYALRGGHITETLLRLFRFAQDSVVMFLPRYTVQYGKVESIAVREREILVEVTPATKYGSLAKKGVSLIVPL